MTRMRKVGRNLVSAAFVILRFNTSLVFSPAFGAPEKTKPETWIQPDPFVSGYLTMSMLASLGNAFLW